MTNDNYFEIFDIPVSFYPDLNLLKKKYYSLSRNFHPDFYTMEPDDVKNEILIKSGKLNTSYKILSDESLRMKYILDMYQLLNDADNKSLDQTFLMNMMEINEAIFDLELEFKLDEYQKLSTSIDFIDAELREKVKKDIDDFENKRNVDLALLNIKEYYLKSKYLLRIRENISTFATLKDIEMS